MTDSSWLKPFYDSQPRWIRRKWRYQPWGKILHGFLWRRHDGLPERYTELLAFGLRNRLKVFFKPQEPESAAMAQLWNMAQVVEMARLPLDAVWSPKSRNQNGQLREWLSAMFLAYPVPEWCLAQWQMPQSPQDVEKLVLLGQGRSPREVLGLSKKEAGAFGEVQPEIASLRGCCIYLAARAQGCSSPIALELARAWLAVGRAGKYSLILEFIRPVAEWLAKRKIPLWHVRPIADYLFRERYCQPGFSLKGRTLAGMLREIDDWHFQLHGYHRNADSWKRRGFSAVMEKAGIVFDELHTAAALRQEGKRQHHCVASYLGACLRGDCAIISMRSLSGEIDLTLEIRPATQAIVQIRGKCNQLPTQEAIKYVQRYASAKQLKIAI